jgi:hypothetical protein
MPSRSWKPWKTRFDAAIPGLPFFLNRIMRLLLFGQRAGLLQSGVVLAKN